MPRPEFWRELKSIIRANNHRNRRGPIASFEWQAKRAEILHAAFRTLWKLGSRPESPSHLRERHVHKLALHWEEQGIRDIQTRMSVMRTFANEWIGKPGMVKDSARYVRDPKTVTRSYPTKTDKSWSGQGADVLEILARVREEDPRIAAILELQFRFGLRLKESLLFQPNLCDRGTHIVLERGAKGGRIRTVSVITPEQAELLSRIKTFAPVRASTMIPPEFTLIAYRNRIYGLTRRLGLTRQKGLALHGLRHEYAAQRYAGITGHPAPLRTDERVDPENDLAARFAIAQDLGHSRPHIVGCYLGGRRLVTRPPAKSEPTGDDPNPGPIERKALWERLLAGDTQDAPPEDPVSRTTPTTEGEKT